MYVLREDLQYASTRKKLDSFVRSSDSLGSLPKLSDGVRRTIVGVSLLTKQCTRDCISSQGFAESDWEPITGLLKREFEGDAAATSCLDTWPALLIQVRVQMAGTSGGDESP